jgi:hypothetical protein
MTRAVLTVAIVSLVVPAAAAAQDPSGAAERPACTRLYDTTIAGVPRCPWAPPGWNPGMPRVSGSPRLLFDPGASTGPLPHEMRAIAGGFVGQTPWEPCTDGLGVLRAEHNPCLAQRYLMVGATRPDGTFDAFELYNGPPIYGMLQHGPVPGPWPWGMTTMGIVRRPADGSTFQLVAYPASGRIEGDHIEWVVRYSPRDSPRFTSERILPDGTVEGTMQTLASSAPWSGNAGGLRFVMYPLMGERLVGP